jgi:hypothetical protein
VEEKLTLNAGEIRIIQHNFVMFRNTIKDIFNNVIGEVTPYLSSLRHCATRWEVAGPIPDAVGIFSLPNLSSLTMALGIV